MSRNQIWAQFDPVIFFAGFIPNKQPNLFNPFISLAHVILELIFAFSSIEYAFDGFLLDFSNIGPSRKILTMRSFAKAWILHNLLMLLVDQHRIKRIWFLDPTFFAVGQTPVSRFDEILLWDVFSGEIYYFIVFGISIRRGIAVGELKHRSE